MTEQLSRKARAQWLGFIAYVKDGRPPIGHILEQTRPTVFEGGFAQLQVSAAFIFAQLDSEGVTAYLEAALCGWFGCRTTLDVMRDGVSAQRPSTTPEHEAGRLEGLKAALELATRRRDYWSAVLQGKAAALLLEGQNAGGCYAEAAYQAGKLEALLKEAEG